MMCSSFGSIRNAQLQLILLLILLFCSSLVAPLWVIKSHFKSSAILGIDTEAIKQQEGRIGLRAAEQGQVVNRKQSKLLAKMLASHAAEPWLCTPTAKISSSNAGRHRGSEQSCNELGG